MSKRVYKNFSFTGKTGNYRIGFVPGFGLPKNNGKIKTIKEVQSIINKLRSERPKMAKARDKEVYSYKGKGSFFG